MAESNAVNFQGAFKRVYVDGKPVSLVPDNAVLQRIIDFKSTKEGPGEAYVFPVQLQTGQSIGFAGPNSGAFAIPDAIPGTIKQAMAYPYQFVAKEEIDFELMARAMKGNSKSSFIDATQTIVENLQFNVRRKVEAQILYGGVEKGVVSSVSGNTITINESDWAALLWNGMQGQMLDIYVGSTGVLRRQTQLLGVQSGMKIVVADATGVSANDTIYWMGERGNTWAGVHKVATTVGSLYGIDNTNYYEWQGNTYNVGGNLTMSKIEEAIALMVEKGFSGDCTLLVSPRVWRGLQISEAAKRQYTNNDTVEFKNGAKGLRFGTVSGGDVKVIPSPFVKNGYGYIINEEEYQRFGPVEFQLGAPGSDQILIPSTNVTASTLIGYGCQGLVCRNPSSTAMLTGITVSSA